MTNNRANKTKKRRENINHGVVRNAPKALIISLVIFAVFALVAGEIFKAYELFWWWDDMLHTVSGVIAGLVGFLAIYFFNARYNMHISPVFVGVFAFTFAITAGVLWEVFEFMMDAFFGLYMQRWNLPADSVLIGRDYQGSGLRDTMSDLIVAGIGSLFAAVFAHYAYKHEKPTALGVMRRTFFWKRPRRTRRTR
jgi:hypothetical protein